MIPMTELPVAFYAHFRRQKKHACITSTKPRIPFASLLSLRKAQYGELVKGHTEAQTSKPGKWNLPFPDVSGA